MTNRTIPTAQHRLDRRCQQAVGNGLTRLYSEMLAEPIPEDFLLLLEKTSLRRASNQAAQ